MTWYVEKRGINTYFTRKQYGFVVPEILTGGLGLFEDR